MDLPRFSVSHPVLVNLVVILLLVGGVVSYLEMTQEVFTQIPLDFVSVVTLYPGVAPDQIEREVSIPIEDSLKGVEEIKKIWSISREGRSVLFMELHEWTADVGRVVDEVQQQVDFTAAEFDADVEKPVVKEFQYFLPVVVYALSGTAGDDELERASDRLEKAILGIPGVARTQVEGTRDREILVEPDPLLLAGHGLSARALVRAIGAKNVNIPGGTVRARGGEKIVRVAGQVQVAAEIGEVIVRRGGAMDAVRVRDVARVRETRGDTEVEVRVEGQPAVTLTVYKSEVGDAIHIKERLDEIVAGLRLSLPAGVEISEYMDTTQHLQDRVKTMQYSLALGLGMVLILLCVFLNWRIAVLTAIGIPVALSFAVVAWFFLGGSINMLSLFAIILVLGMVVDDGIIISENVYRHIERGKTPLQAAVDGSRQVMGAVVLAVCTTIAAFLPLLLTEGRIGKFLAVIPIVATLALLGSLLEVLFVLPSHVADFVPANRSVRRRRPILRFFIDTYVYMLKKFIRRRWILAPLFVVIAVACLGFAGEYMDVVFFSSDYVELVIIRLEVDPAFSLEQTTEVVEEVERGLESLPDSMIKSKIAHVGMEMNQQGFFFYRNNLAYLMVALQEGYSSSHTKEEAISAVHHVLGRISHVRRLEVDGAQEGPPQEKDIRVRLQGDDYLQQVAFSSEVLEVLRNMEGVDGVSSNVEPGKKELAIQLDEDVASQLGFDVQTLAAEIRAVYEGQVASKMRWGNEEIEVVIRYPEIRPFRLEHLERLILTSPTGRQAPVHDLARIHEIEGLSLRARYQRRPTVTITADVDSGVTSVAAVDEKLQEELSDWSQRHAGSEVKFGGGLDDLAVMTRSMIRAGLVALLIIYMILGSLFRSFLQPIVVMFTVPFSLIGVIFGLLLAGEPLSFMALMGAVALAGIVVNDSLVLVDFINQARLEGQGIVRAVIGAARIRFRPILLTSITTIVGLLPLAVGMTGHEVFLAPMAIAIIWGLVFSTALTLLVIPCIYLVVDDLRRFFMGRDMFMALRQRRKELAGID